MVRLPSIESCRATAACVSLGVSPQGAAGAQAPLKHRSRLPADRPRRGTWSKTCRVQTPRSKPFTEFAVVEIDGRKAVRVEPSSPSATWSIR